jgi:MFS family permease
VINAYTLAYGGLLLGGRLGDILGQRRALMIGVTPFTSASLTGGLAREPWWLLASRAPQPARKKAGVQWRGQVRLRT